MLSEEVTGTELKLTDIVRLDADAFPDAIVYQITNTVVKLHRPYMAHAEFMVGGNKVITFIGQELFSRPITHTFLRVQHGSALKW